MKKNKLLSLAAVVMCISLLFVGCGSDESAEGGSEKEITLTVVHKDETRVDFPLTTTAEFLGEAYEEEGIISGTESEYGLSVETADGETVDADKEEWWNLQQDGVSTTTGIDSTPIEDGDTFELIFTVGW